MIRGCGVGVNQAIPLLLNIRVYYDWSIGQMFALTEMQIILAIVVQRFKLRLAAGASIYPNPLLTLRAGDKLPMRSERRFMSSAI